VAKHPPRPQLGEDKIAKIIELWKQGTNKTILAYSFDVSRPRIAQIIKNHLRDEKIKRALPYQQTE
jgi:hypothetical protein